jgi:2'-5' RNA ligase
MDIGSNGFERINSYALVAYIPDPLGRFLDDLRRLLVPGSDPHAHVTLLPPRPLQAPAEALAQIRDFAEHLPVFEVEATKLAVFPKTNVIYIEIGNGREMLTAAHGMLNRDALAFTEPFPYHPHITLAQELPPEEVPAAVEIAQRWWNDYPHPRVFPVRQLAFVQNSNCNRWTDLATVPLAGPIPVPVRR